MSAHSSMLLISSELSSAADCHVQGSLQAHNHFVIAFQIAIFFSA